MLDGLSHDIVLGMDFLAKHNPTVDFAARELLFADGQRVFSVAAPARASVELCSMQ